MTEKLINPKQTNPVSSDNPCVFYCLQCAECCKKCSSFGRSATLCGVFCDFMHGALQGCGLVKRENKDNRPWAEDCGNSCCSCCSSQNTNSADKNDSATTPLTNKMHR